MDIKEFLKRARLKSIYYAMKQRCYNSNCCNYRYYGKKGITICDEWNNSKNFINWALQNGYKNNLTIDRINSNSNYEPDNCRWITRSENSKRAAHNKKKERCKKMKDDDLTYIQNFSKINVSQICRDLKVDRANVLNGRASKETIRKVKEEIEKRLTTLK